jgi:hypothetical protein
MTALTLRQMVAAELLKLRRQRTLMVFAAVLSIGIVVIFMGYLQLRHASNPTQYGPAGGIGGFEHLLRVLGVFFGALVAILIGTEAGTADLSSGVFRDLVATGRSRRWLFAVRLPAAIALTLAFSGAAFLLGLLGTFLFAGSQTTPSVGAILEGAAWIVAANSVMVALAVGVGSMTGSRAVTLTAVIGWQTVATQLILNVASLGAIRDLLPNSALGQLVPVGPNAGVAMSAVVAIAVLVGWAVIPTVAGAWRTITQDA